MAVPVEAVLAPVEQGKESRLLSGRSRMATSSVDFESGMAESYMKQQRQEVTDNIYRLMILLLTAALSNLGLYALKTLTGTHESETPPGRSI